MAINPLGTLGQTNNVDDIYGTNPQVKFARDMAEYLAKQKHYTPNASMAVLPGSWMYGIKDVISALGGNQYRDIAGIQDKKLSDAQAGIETDDSNVRYGRGVGQPGQPPSPPSPPPPPPAPVSAAPTSGSAVASAGATPPPAMTTGSLGQSDAPPYDPQSGAYNRGELGIVNRINPKAAYMKRNRDIGDVDGTIVHYDRANSADLAKYGESVDPRRGFDPNYHFAIDPDGTISQNVPLNKIANHAMRFNGSKIGIVLTGTDSSHGPTGAAMASLENLQHNLADDLGFDAANIRGHGDTTSRKSGEAETEAGEISRASMETDEEKAQTGQEPGRSGITEREVPDIRRGANRLGGPKPDGSVDVAQASPYASQPQPNPNSPPSPDPALGGAQVPPQPPMEDQKMLGARLRGADPSQRQQIIENHLERAKGRSVDYPGATVIQTPQGGGQGVNTAIPGKDTDITVGNIHSKLRMTPGPDGKLTPKFLLPDGGWGTLDDLQQYVRENRAKDIRTEGRATEATKRYSDMERDIAQRSQGASVNIQTLQLAKQLSNDPNFYSGTGADKVLDYKKIASYITGNPYWSGSVEAFSKILARANIEGLEAFKGYGQIRNPEIELLRESSGNISNTPGAIQAIIDINSRASQRLMDIGRLMRQYRDEHGELNEGFDKQLANFYKDNPLYSDDEIKNYRSLFKMSKDKDMNEWTTVWPGVRRRKKED